MKTQTIRDADEDAQHIPNINIIKLLNNISSILMIALAQSIVLVYHVFFLFWKRGMHLRTDRRTSV